MAQCLRVRLRTDSLGSTLSEAVFFSLLYISFSIIFFPFSLFPFILVAARKRLCFSAQSEGTTAAIVWNWSAKTLSPGPLLTVLYYSSCHIFPPV